MSRVATQKHDTKSKEPMRKEAGHARASVRGSLKVGIITYVIRVVS